MAAGVNGLPMFVRALKKYFLSRSSSHAFRPSLRLAECFELANDETYTRSYGFIKNRAYQFFSEESRIELVSEYVKKRFGLAEFQYIGCGDNAVVVRYAECQVLRFRAPPVETEVNTQRVHQRPFICPIWREFEFEGARLDFVPHVPSVANALSADIISRELAEEYVFALLRAGFESSPPLWFYDYKKSYYKCEQIGLLPDATPIIIDQGSVILESEAPRERFDRLVADKSQAYMRTSSPRVSWGGSWIDKMGRPKIEALPKPDQRIMS
jgi:hypothetical protein